MEIKNGQHLLGSSPSGRSVVVRQEIGIFNGITQEQYRFGIGQSNSQLGTLMKSPRAYWWQEDTAMKKELAKVEAMEESELSDEPSVVNDEEKKKSLVLGSAMHKCVLEPMLWDTEFLMIPEGAPKRPTITQINAAKPSPKTVDAIAFWQEFDAALKGRTAITVEQFNTMWAMYDALKTHWFMVDGDRINTIDLFKDGHAEASMYWEDEETGVFCKGRPDYIRDGFLADYKTARDGTLYGFQKSMADYGYYRQSPFYLDGARQATGGQVNHDKFIFVVQETTAPYEVSVFAIGPTSQGIGRADYRECLHRYVENEAKYGAIGDGEMWPMACQSIIDVELPQWAMYRGTLTN